MHGYGWRITHIFSFTFPQLFDVFTGKITVLNDKTNFVVSVNPTGVVMWYVSEPAKLDLHRFYKGGRLRGSAYDDNENTIPHVFL